MANHRVGNSYLSDEEKVQHTDACWKAGIFFVTLLISALLLHLFVIERYHFTHVVNFIILVLPSLAIAILAAWLHRKIRFLLSIGFLIAFLAVVGWGIWRFLC